jgi:hypothetical protein
VQAVLSASRALRADSDILCLAFQTHRNGEVIQDLGPDPVALAPAIAGSRLTTLHRRDVIVLSIAVTETTFDRVDVVRQTLTARLHTRTEPVS